MHRRTFLQKAVYAAPTLLALGGLSKPTQAEAGFGGPPSDPNFILSQTGSQSADSESGDVVSTTLKNSSSDNDIVAQTLDSEL